MTTATPRLTPPVRVIICDDYALIREGIRAAIERPDIEIVGEARTGAEAVWLVRQQKPNIVFMDVQMPDMDGFASTRIIKKWDPSCMVVILTGFEDTEYLRQALAAGASGYLLKKFDPKTLLSAIDRLKNGESLLQTEEVARLLGEMQEPGPLTPGFEPGEYVPLSLPENLVLKLLGLGLSNAQITAKLQCSSDALEEIMERITSKMGVSAAAGPTAASPALSSPGFA